MTHTTEPQALQAVLWGRTVPSRLTHDAQRDLPWTRIGVYPIRDWWKSTVNERVPRATDIVRNASGAKVQLAHIAQPAVAPCTCATRVWPTDSAEWEGDE
jgi:hypothetical protein